RAAAPGRRYAAEVVLLRRLVIAWRREACRRADDRGSSRTLSSARWGPGLGRRRTRQPPPQKARQRSGQAYGRVGPGIRGPCRLKRDPRRPGGEGETPLRSRRKARRYGDATVVLSPLAVTVKTPHGFDV